MMKAQKWLDWDGGELIPKSGEMPEISEYCDGDPDCENKPVITIRPYYHLMMRNEELCQECYDRRLEGP